MLIMDLGLYAQTASPNAILLKPQSGIAETETAQQLYLNICLKYTMHITNNLFPHTHLCICWVVFHTF